MQPEGLKVVFTGPAYGPNGEQILRNDLAAACKAAGMIVQSAVAYDTQLLVCSRTNTVKAAKAANRGIQMMTYPIFLVFFSLSPKASKAAIPDRYVDTHKSGPHPSLLGVGAEL